MTTAHDSVSGHKAPDVWLLRGDAALAQWKSPSYGIAPIWLEGRDADRHPFGPWIDVARGHPSGGDVASRLSNGPPYESDPDDPVLPDPFDAFACVGAWLERLASQQRLVLVLRDAPHYGQDSLNLLLFVTRYMRLGPISILLIAHDTDASTAWPMTLSLLREEIGVTGDLALEVSNPLSGLAASASDARAISYCRVGAVQEGGRLLGEGLTTRGGDATSWQTLAMVGLSLQRHDVVEAAVGEVFRSEAPWRQKARAARTWMLALRQANRAADLRRAGSLINIAGGRECDDAVPVAWMYLDLALVSSAFEDPSEHIAHLDRLLGLPVTEVPLACHATALIWRGAAHYLNEDLSRAAESLAPAIELLAELGDFSRSQHVHGHYGTLLAALGRWTEALPVLAEATRRAVALGKYDLAAICATEYASASLALNHTVSNESAGGLTGWKADKVWQSSVGRKLSVLVAARTALAAERFEDAYTLAEQLITAITSAEYDVAPFQMRLLCETAFLHADIAAARHDQASPWLLAGLRWADQAPAEDRPLLRNRGITRISIL